MLLLLFAHRDELVNAVVAAPTPPDVTAVRVDVYPKNIQLDIGVRQQQGLCPIRNKQSVGVCLLIPAACHFVKVRICSCYNCVACEILQLFKDAAKRLHTHGDAYTLASLPTWTAHSEYQES
jgi:hypothetical protein